MDSEQTIEINQVPIIDRKYILKKVPSGEVRLELGADGTYLMFDCDCLDALPMCHSQCCALKGTEIHSPEEEERLDKYLEWDDVHGMIVMIRDADGFCTALDRPTSRCSIYDDRPQTCRSFHCTRGARMRGWKLPNSLATQSFH